MTKTCINKSFLKWAGGKSKLLDEIFALLPPGRRLLEPFMGSGVVFLNSEHASYVGGDVNEDLVSLYSLLSSKQSEDLISAAEALFIPENNTQKRFYEIRQEFNETSDRFIRATHFVYLNRHAFNGLCRYNSKGEFNVPFGNYKNAVCPSASMRGFSEISKKRHAKFLCKDFEHIFGLAEEGDVIYCDPPYAPLSPTSSFSSYAAGGFGKGEHERLASCCRQAAAKGVPVLVSNHDTEWVRTLYSGATIKTLNVHRSVSCKGDKRGKAPEVLALFGSFFNGGAV